MNDDLQQLARVSALLTNWDGIRALMEPLSPAASQELAGIAARLARSESPGEIARAIDDLLDLTLDTPANRYVRELIARSSVDTGAGLRSLGVAAAHTQEARGDSGAGVRNLVSEAARGLASAVSEEAAIQKIPVFFATNRRPADGEKDSARFLGEPADELSFGIAPVSIPVAKHRLGRVETPHWWTLFRNNNPEGRFIIAVPRSLGRVSFLSELESAAASGGARDLLIFVHGYNVSFEEACRRAAQFSHDMSFNGVVVLFSWPSLGSFMGYAADEDRASGSGEALCQLFNALTGGPWKRVHVVAHSMGNRVLLSGFADNPRVPLSFGQIVMVAADVYVNVFTPKWGKITAAGPVTMTSYASKRDLALRISDWIHKANRVGFVEVTPYSVGGMDTIDASVVDTGLIGHSYFAAERSVITDLGLLVRKGFTPAERGLQPGTGGRYWMFPR